MIDGSKDINSPIRQNTNKLLIEKEQPQKAIEIVGYGMMCPTCKLKYLKLRATRCESCGQRIIW